MKNWFIKFQTECIFKYKIISKLFEIKFLILGIKLEHWLQGPS